MSKFISCGIILVLLLIPGSSLAKSPPTTTNWWPEIEGPTCTYVKQYWDGSFENYEGYILFTIKFGWGAAGLKKMQNMAIKSGWKNFVLEINRWPRSSDPEDWDGVWARFGPCDDIIFCAPLHDYWKYWTDMPNPNNHGVEEYDSWFGSRHTYTACHPWCQWYNPLSMRYDNCQFYEVIGGDKNGCDEEYELEGTAADFVDGKWYYATIMFRIDKNPAQACQKWDVQFYVGGDGTASSPYPSSGVVANGHYATRPDSDSDGLPDMWECKYWQNVKQKPTDDPDSDCWSNLHEYKCKYDPTKKSSPGKWCPCRKPGECL